MLTAETKRRIDACRDVLVGKLPLPTDQVELITLALIYKFMDDLDEESVAMGGKRSFFTGELAPYRWRNLLPQTVSAEQRMTLFAEGLEALGNAKKAAHLPGLFRDIFRNAFLKFRDGRILTLFLTEVNGFAYSHSEELGNAFEYLLQCMGTQGENGQFRTPRHIIDFMVACLDPQPGDKILDPACGTGGFLVSAFRHILARHTSGRDGRNGQSIPGDLLTHAQRQAVYQNLAGYDITDLMVKLSKVNLFLHGFPDPAIHIYDTLSNDARWHEKADLILANPPFMTPKGGVTPHTRFRIAARKAEVLFTDYIAEHLTADGRGGVIVPNGIVATTQNAYVKLRRYLVEDSLVAVVSLPAGVFKPYSGVKTSILFLDKKLARQRREILFLKITADGFDLGDKRTPIEANDLPEAERVVKLWLAGKLKEGTASTVAWRAVEKRTLLANKDVTLNAERYMGGGDVEHEHEVVTIGEICLDVQSGYSCSASKQTTSGVPHLRSQNITNQGQLTWEGAKFVPEEIAAQNESYALRRGDILFNNTNSVELVGKTCLYDSNERAHYSNHTTRLRVDEARALPKFVALALHQLFKRGEFAKLCTRWVGQAGVSTTLLKQVEIPLPPLEEQRRIVAEIEGYQKVLDGARQILAGYRPRIEANPDWDFVPLGDAAELTGGYAFKSTELKPAPANGSDLPVVKIGNVGRDGRLDMADAEFHTFTPDLARYVLRTGDIVVAMTGATVGKVAEVDRDNLLLNQRVGVVRRKETAEQKFLLHVLRSPDFYDFCQTTAGGGAQGDIAPRQILEYEIPLPPLEEQRRIVAELDAEAAQMEAVRALIPRFEAKIQRVLDRVWGQGGAA
jgi:type I restriction enzyme M protein